MDSDITFISMSLTQKKCLYITGENKNETKSNYNEHLMILGNDYSH